MDNAGALVSPLGSPPRLLDVRLRSPMVAEGRESPRPKLVILGSGKNKRDKNERDEFAVRVYRPILFSRIPR